MYRNKIAILLTSHNRKEITLRCIQSIYEQRFFDNIACSIYLVDAGSSDGTVCAVREKFPYVELLSRDGSLFWCGGMREAWLQALKISGFDFYLWLNDYTFLEPGAINDMWSVAQDHFGIIVGSCHDLRTGDWTYGGRVTHDGKKSLCGTPVVPSSEVQYCQQVNGNVVLVPKAVIQEIGILSDSFTHAMGDFDYGFRALDAGIPLIIPPNYQATCSANSTPAWCDLATPLRKRIALFNTPKGIHFSEFMIFCYRHFGLKCFLIGAKVILRLLLPGLWQHREGGRA